jgi:hypothetical protein
VWNDGALHHAKNSLHPVTKGTLTMKPIVLFTFLFSLCAGICANAQTPTPAKYRICMDIAHQQKFWHDPADMAGMDAKFIERVKYMTGEFVKTATSVDARLSYLKTEITAKGLEGCDLLFISYSFCEVHAR